MRFRRSNVWLLPALVVILAVAAGCASGASYRMAPESAPSAQYGGGDKLQAMDRGDASSVTASDDGDYEVDADEPVPMSEPEGDSTGSMPPPAPPAEHRYAQSGPSTPKPPTDPAAAGPSTAVPPDTTTDVPQPQPTGKPADQGDPKLAGPLLIYDATIYMAVYEAQKSIDATQKLATDMGGYLVKRDDRTITVRVPAKAFRKALEGVGKLGDVLHREETVKDVTDQFYDLQVRLKNAHAMRDRLAKLLDQAKNVEEALMVEKELGRVTEQIELFEGKLKLLKELIAFSTITVEFKPRPTDRVSNVRLPFYWLNQLGLSQLLSL